MANVNFPLTQAQPDLEGWIRAFSTLEVPVLTETAEALEGLRANEDDVDANMLGELIAGDPLMTLKVMAHAAAHRSARVVTDTETVTAAIVMMGISPFFRAFGPQPTVEQRLADHPEALQGLHRVVQRAHRAANFALGFAVHRAHPEAAILHQAGLLHDFAEMLLYCHAPSLATRIEAAQREDPTLRSSVIQQQVLNLELVDLQHALMLRWRLPELLTRVTDDRHAEQTDVRSVMLAVRLARHTANGWDNAALPDDVADVAALLNLSVEAASALVHDLGE